MSASTGSEPALESDKWKHGLFSYCLIQALKDQQGSNTNKDFDFTIQELVNRLKIDVIELSGGKQHPEYYSINDAIRYNF